MITQEEAELMMRVLDCVDPASDCAIGNDEIGACRDIVDRETQVETHTKKTKKNLLPLSRPGDERLYVIAADNGVRFFIDHQSFDIHIEYEDDVSIKGIRSRNQWYARQLKIALSRLATIHESHDDVIHDMDYGAGRGIVHQEPSAESLAEMPELTEKQMKKGKRLHPWKRGK